MILPTASFALAGWVAVLAYGVQSVAATRLKPVAAHTLLWIGWVFQALALAIGLGVLGEVPRFGFAPALSVTGWLALTVYGLESRRYPELRGMSALGGLCAASVLIMLVFPGSELHVQASPWLPVHWALGVACYGLFAAAMVHGWAMTRAEKQMRLANHQDVGLPLLTLERLTFRFIAAGFIVLSATLLAGWWFGEGLQGASRVRRWDHKVVFSVLAWVTFAALLFGRMRFGWRGRQAVRWLYAGSGLLLLAYVGSRFVMEVVLGRGL